MNLYIVRHGETDYNANGIVQGHLDSKLTEKGRRQVELLAERLKDVRFDHVYSSDMLRTRQTTEIIMKYQDCPMTYAESIRERNMGTFSGKTREELHDYMEKNNYYNDFHKRIPEGESVYEVRKRTVEFLEEITKKHKGETILISTHGGPKLSMMMHLNGLPIEKIVEYPIRFNNASLSMIKFHENNNYEIILENDIEHLSSL